MTDSEALVVGFDGFPGGWMGCLWRGPGYAPRVVVLRSLWDAETALSASLTVSAIDIPLGLQEAALPGGRPSDICARKRLGPRRSPVFSPPARAALRATAHPEASMLNRSSGAHAPGLSKQTFEMFKKLRDANAALEGSEWLRNRSIEIHPEVSFAAMLGAPLANPKKQAAGREERRHLLRDRGFGNISGFESDARSFGTAADDALDACAAAWTAWRRATGAAEFLPPHADGPNYWMRIWY